MPHSPGKGTGSAVRDPQAGSRAGWQASCHLVVRHAKISIQRPRSYGGPGARRGAALRRRLRAAGRLLLVLVLRLLLLRGTLLLAAEAAVQEQQAGAHGGER